MSRADDERVADILDAARRGEDDANALMSEFPASEANELVTKQFLRAELAELRSEMVALENRLTLRLGGAIGVATAVLGALITVQ